MVLAWAADATRASSNLVRSCLFLLELVANPGSRLFEGYNRKQATAALAQELPGTFLIRQFKDKLILTIKKPALLNGYNHIGITMDGHNYSISESEAFSTLADLVGGACLLDWMHAW